MRGDQIAGLLIVVPIERILDGFGGQALRIAPAGRPVVDAAEKSRIAPAELFLQECREQMMVSIPTDSV